MNRRENRVVMKKKKIRRIIFDHAVLKNIRLVDPASGAARVDIGHLEVRIEEVPMDFDESLVVDQQTLNHAEVICREIRRTANELVHNGATLQAMFQRDRKALSKRFAPFLSSVARLAWVPRHRWLYESMIFCGLKFIKPDAVRLNSRSYERELRGHLVTRTIVAHGYGRV